MASISVDADLVITGKITQSGTPSAAGDLVTKTFADGAYVTAVNFDEAVRDRVAATLVAGTNVTITPNDPGDTITISASGGGGTAATTTFTPTGNTYATGTNVQDAINGLDFAMEIIYPAAGQILSAATNFNPGAIYLNEELDNGSDSIGITAPAALSASYTLTLPQQNSTLATTTDLTAKVDKTTVPVHIAISLSAVDGAFTTGTGKEVLHLPYGLVLTSVYAEVATVSSSGVVTVDINEGAGAGTTILSTKLTIDATEETSGTAAVPAVISDTSLAANARITFDIDTAGTGAKGLKVHLIGTRSV